MKEVLVRRHIGTIFIALMVANIVRLVLALAQPRLNGLTIEFYNRKRSAQILGASRDFYGAGERPLYLDLNAFLFIVFASVFTYIVYRWLTSIREETR